MASEIGKACRDLLPLYIDGDWRTLPIEEKQRAWERVQVRLNLDDIMNNPIKFRAADRWMSKLHKRHRADVKKKWKQVGYFARPISSHDEDCRKITHKWQDELDEEKEILSSEQPTGKRTKSMKARGARKAIKYLHRIHKFQHDDIEFFKQMRYCDPKPDGSSGWVNQHAAETYNKMVEMHLISQSSDVPISSSDVVDKFMGAASRSDYHPGKGYGPPSIGKSFQRKCLEAQFEQALMETRANDDTQIAALKQINMDQGNHINQMNGGSSVKPSISQQYKRIFHSRRLYMRKEKKS